MWGYLTQPLGRRDAVHLGHLDIHHLAEKTRLSVPQVSLAHVMSQPLDIFVLVDCANRDKFAANVAALEMRLTSTEMAWLDLRQDEVPA